MKKFAGIFLSALIALMFSIASAEQANQVEITFRGFTWYAPFPEINEQMDSLTDKYTSASSNQTIDHYTRGEWSMMFSDNRVETGGVSAYYSDIPVAGYTADSVMLYYMYPLGEDGRVVRDDNEAQFYFGMYTFKKVEDKQATYDDLKAKLTSLYGKGKNDGTKYINSEMWTDGAGNLAWLIVDKDLREVRLVYAAGDSDARLDALQAQIKAEVIEAENAKREANSSNTDGL